MKGLSGQWKLHPVKFPKWEDWLVWARAMTMEAPKWQLSAINHLNLLEYFAPFGQHQMRQFLCCCHNTNGILILAEYMQSIARCRNENNTQQHVHYHLTQFWLVMVDIINDYIILDMTILAFVLNVRSNMKISSTHFSSAQDFLGESNQSWW